MARGFFFPTMLELFIALFVLKVWYDVDSIRKYAKRQADALESIRDKMGDAE